MKRPKITTTQEYFTAKQVVEQYKTMNARFKQMEAVLGVLDYDHGLVHEICTLFDSYVSAMSLLIDDSNDRLSWYLFDNLCGTGGKAVHVGAMKWEINNIADLAWLIREEKGVNK